MSNAPRRQDIEWLRVAACLGIVWYHAHAPGDELALAGLIVFVVMSVVLARTGRVPLGASLRERAQRLLLPWAFWWAVYGAAGLATGHAPTADALGWPALLLAGPSIHLWYLPFIFVTLMVLDLVWPASSEQVVRGLGLAGAAMCSGALALLALAILNVRDFVYPFAQYLQVLPAVMAAVFMRSWPSLQASARVQGVGLLTSAMLVLACHPVAGIGWPYLIGLPLCLLVLRPGAHWPVPWPATRLAGATLGIYLVHPLVLMVFAKLGFSVRQPLVVLAVFATAWAGVALAHRLAPDFSRRVM